MSDRFKYPRTPHLPWSPGGSKDDAYLVDTSHFEEREVVITEKMDGENTTMYRDGIHARSIDSRHHPSRDWVKALHGQICNEIPEGWRLCGENVFAQHSVIYEDLKSYFYLFSVWNAENEALSWEETREWADLLGLVLVPQMYLGPWDEPYVRSIQIDTQIQEGYVVRLSDRFAYEQFGNSLAKWVRSGHVQTDQHWMYAEIIPNQLAADEDEVEGDDES